MEGFDNERDYGAILTERLKAEALQEKKANVPHVTVFDLMTAIYNYMSECYTSSDIRTRATAVKVLTDEIAVELLAELEGLEP